MDATTRANRFPVPRSASLEYAVHGHFKRSPEDTNGLYGTWWVDVPKLRRSGVDIDELEIKLKAFEFEQQEAREEAIARAAEEAEAEAEEEEDT